MVQFLEEKLSIVQDGDLHINEVIAIAIIVVALVLVVLLMADKIKHQKNKETTIFSHRKNKYKNRIGKKHKF